jgi:cephalosporin-C deacetylase
MNACNRAPSVVHMAGQTCDESEHIYMTVSFDAPPADFAAYWDGVMAELDALPVAAEITPVLLRSSPESTLYEARLTSIGPYRVLAHYSVPNRGNGPFPVVYHAPGYGSVVHIPPFAERTRYVTVALRHRGQRLSDQPFQAAYPGLLTTGIESPARYVYRGIVADCCRVIDFLATREEVAQNQIAVVGNDLALLTAALRPQVDALYCAPGLFYAASQLAPQTEAYPLEEFNDYARYYPDQAAAMWETLAYFEPAYFAPRIQAETVIVNGGEGALFSPEVVQPLMDAIGGNASGYASQHSSYLDGVRQATWLAERYSIGEAPLPPHWQG